DERNEPAWGHFDHAMDLAGRAHDCHWIAFALYGAGRITAEGGHPDDALKFYQLAQIATEYDNRHPRASALAGWLHNESALELAHLGHHQVREELAAAKDARAAGRDVDRADMDHISAMTYMALHDMDKAEQFATSAVNQWEGSLNRRHAIFAKITHAAIYVKTGEPRGLALASNAINGVAQLRSVRARKRLEVLATTLESRSGADMRDLARQARRLSEAVA
ncbi:MAG: hypothetical protein LC775_00550, partial [Acidobacteria bacterium]|nr:hypothetical protein [Acidobacteriota bacterium]